MNRAELIQRNSLTTIFYRIGCKVILSADLIFFSAIYVVFLFFYTFSVNYKGGISYQQYLLPLTIFYFCASTALKSFQKQVININALDVIALIGLAVISLLNHFYDGFYLIKNETLYNLAILLLIYLFIRQATKFELERFFIPVFMFGFFIELIIGIWQAVNLSGQKSANLFLTGSLENSGIYSIFLVIHLPFLGPILKSLTRNRFLTKSILVMLFALTAVLILYAQSRTAILLMFAFLCVSTIRSVKIRCSRAKAVGLLSLGGVLGVLVIYSLIVFRLQSISGRILTWKICLQNLHENFFTGIGIGNFPSTYPRWQIKYFQSLPEKQSSEILFADETFVAFNEPLQFIIEAGLPGFILLVCILMLVISKSDEGSARARANISGNLRPIPERAYRLSLLMILTSTLVSYTLHVNAIAMLFVFLLAMRRPGTLRQIRIAPVWIFACLAVLLIFSTKSLSAGKIAKQWEEIRMSTEISEVERASAYQILYPLLQNNGKFLLDYAESLYLLDSAQEASRIIGESLARHTTAQSLVRAGEIFQSSGELKKAIGAYQDLTNLVPYKFGYKKTLFSLYVADGDTLNARSLANLILRMPVKKADHRVAEIKKSVADYLAANSTQ